MSEYKDNRIPFTYLVTQKTTGKRYYGSKYGKNCNPSDLGTKISLQVKKLRKLLN